MNFGDILRKESEKKLTENLQLAYSTAGEGALLDLFATAGALRPRAEEEIEEKFRRAFQENPLMALKLLFYIGDIRQGGLGERRTFRIILKWLGENYPKVAEKVVHLVPTYNRWDSVFSLVGTPAEADMWSLVDFIWKLDLMELQAGNSVSLLAKWMPSPNTSSKATRALAQKAMKGLGIEKESLYRRYLSRLRERIGIVERKMSAREWDEIRYEAVPSYAIKNYRKAFECHDTKRWKEYVNSQKKVNASVLFPYDLVREIWNGPDQLITRQWDALPNYLTDDKSNILVMADVSGSMWGRPMETSIGLAIYFAERNKGMFKNLYMTFTDRPQIIQVDPSATLYNKVRQVRETGVGFNTDLAAAYQRLLEVAISNKIPRYEMPKAIVVISDMEIDRVLERDGVDFVGYMRQKFEDSGYQFPKLVCWNVQARQDTFLSQERDVLLVSGQSAATFKHLVGSLDKTAQELMDTVLNSKTYDLVQLPQELLEELEDKFKDLRF